MRKPLTLTVDAWGNVIVARTLGNEGTFVAKLDKEGNVLWQQMIAINEVVDDADLPVGLSGPTAAAATEPVRDSVEPLLIDPEIEAMQRDLRGPSKLFRGLGIAAILAGLFAFGLAGGAALRAGSSAATPTHPAAAVAGIRGATQMKAQSAVASVSFEHDAVETVDDTVDPSPPTATVAAESTTEPESDGAIGASEPVLVPTSPPVAAGEPAPVDEPRTPPVASEPESESKSSGINDDDLAVIGSAAIRAETLRLLNAGRMEEAAQLGMQLVAAAPSDAFSYLCLGAALQARGRIAEAASAYRSCAEFAKHGDVSECRALAGL